MTIRAEIGWSLGATVVPRKRGRLDDFSPRCRPVCLIPGHDVGWGSRRDPMPDAKAETVWPLGSGIRRLSFVPFKAALDMVRIRRHAAGRGRPSGAAKKIELMRAETETVRVAIAAQPINTAADS